MPLVVLAIGVLSLIAGVIFGALLSRPPRSKGMTHEEMERIRIQGIHRSGARNCRP